MLTVQPGPKTVYTKNELSAELGLSLGMVHRLLKSGQIRSVKAGRRVLVPAEAVADFLKGGAQ